MSAKHTPEYWRDAVKKIRATTPHRVLLKDVGRALDITGRQSIMNAISVMLELNVIYFEQDGDKREYYLND